MEFEVRERIVLEDGRHEGTITRIEYRTEPYKYTDLFIKEEKSQLELKYGCPSNVSMDSKFGKLLGKFIELKPKMKIDPEKVLVGKEVVFMTMQEEGSDNKTYTRIVEGSLKPKVETENVRA